MVRSYKFDYASEDGFKTYVTAYRTGEMGAYVAIKRDNDKTVNVAVYRQWFTVAGLLEFSGFLQQLAAEIDKAK